MRTGHFAALAAGAVSAALAGVAAVAAPPPLAVAGETVVRTAGGAAAAAAASSGDSAASRVGTTPLSLAVRTPIESFAPAPERIELGRRLFGDTRLSEPEGMSCASCHVPAMAFAGGRIGAAGVASGSRPGHFASRAAPSLYYVRYTPALYFYRDQDATAPEPRGGLFADGRSDALADAIALPLFNPDEMNNRSASRLAEKLAASTQAELLRQAFGRRLFDDPAAVLRAVGQALEAYLDSDAMAPFASRYDRYLRGEGRLTDAERNGMRLFADPDKGNCGSCHVFDPTSTNPVRSLFTDFGYDAIAAPRNRALSANRDPKHFDLGICDTGAARGWPDASQWCGHFKTPSLRNVATRGRFMHNGVFDSLRQSVEFYATRATDPAHWYAARHKFDDLPATAWKNVNVKSVPFNRRPGTLPALAPAEIDAIVSFLEALTDTPAPAPAVPVGR